MPCAYVVDLTDSFLRTYGWYIVVKISEFLSASGHMNVTVIDKFLI